MEEIGFQEVKEKLFEVRASTWPKGSKPKELGLWFQADLLDVLTSSLPLFTKVLGWTRDKVEM